MNMIEQATTKDAYQLFHEGTLALARAERQGIRLDVNYCEKQKKLLTNKINRAYEKFKETKLYHIWNKVYKDKTNLDSNHQLGYILYHIMKIEPPKLTVSGKGATDEEALMQLDLPELKWIKEIRKFKKIRDTYLDSFLREQNNGYLHPFFNLHTVKTYRSSCRSPNIQNIPRRDAETMAICRRALYARPGHQLVEIDYHALEVSISACINKDPNLIRYLTNPESDMHGDMAIQIFMLYDYMNLIDKAGGVSKVPEFKVLRDATKNGFVFPQFYGDYYGNNAVSIACDWCKLPKGKWRKNQGIKIVNDRTIGEHFIEHGIKSLDDFIEYMKKIEHDFWHNKFGVYGQWREDWYKEYQRKGYFDLLTGFRCSGIMRRNEVVNYPVQGAAFHCLLKTFIEVDKIMRKENWDSRLVGQIHDSILLDVHPDELEHVIKTVRRVATVKLPRIWKWIIVPLSVEADVTPVDGSWADKKEYDGGI